MRPINFLRERQAEITRRKLVCRIYAVRVGILLAVGIVGLLPLQSAVVSARREYGAAQVRTTAIDSRVKEQRELQKQLDTKSQQALRFAEAEKRTQAWRKVLGDVAMAMPRDVWVTAITSQSDGSVVTMTLTCEGTSLELATQFVMALKRSGTFTSAKLSATRNDAMGYERKVRFECVITVSDKVLGAPAASTPAPAPEATGENRESAKGNRTRMTRKGRIIADQEAWECEG